MFSLIVIWEADVAFSLKVEFYRKYAYIVAFSLNLF